jgi:transposase
MAKDIVSVLNKTSMDKRLLVKGSGPGSAVKGYFPKAMLVTDRFHVVKLAMEALLRIRINLRWDELDKENKAIGAAKSQGKNIGPKSWKMATAPNSSWPAAATYWQRKQRTGQKASDKEQRYFLPDALSSKPPTNTKTPAPKKGCLKNG